MKISIIGTGYVGLVAGVCFADAGHSVTCADSNTAKIDLLNQGKLPFYEPGLSDLFLRNQKRMKFVSTVAEATQASPVIFVAVGTPELPDGSADMEPTFRVIQEICSAATEKKFIVLKSTVPIGTSRKVDAFIKELSKLPHEVINNPEFLKQGAAVEDFVNPDRVVIGARSEEAQQLMRELYEPFLKDESPLLIMDNTSAEMTKYAANSFLALKISFINELALLADLLGADIESVKEGFTSDNRINPSFFHPGIGYGGSCFPKDVRALMYSGKEQGLDLKLLKAADEVNERQKTILSDRLMKRFESLEGKRIALWGLSFKPNTDDVRRAPSLKLIEDLVSRGATVAAYDPVASDNAVAACKAKFEVFGSALQCVENADALVIVTEWNEFKTPNLQQLKSTMKNPLVFDGRNLFDPAKMSEAGFEYYGIGRQVRM